jgi:hypothetical protein
MPAYQTITPPGTLEAAIAPIAELSDAEFHSLARATSLSRSFSLNSKGLKDLKSQITSLSNNLPFVLGALSFLYSQIDALGDGTDSFESIVSKLVDELEFDNIGADKKASLQKRLEILLQKNPAYAKFRKIRRLQDGFVPNATSFRTMVDLRPDFGEGDEIAFQGLLKIIQFRVMTDSTNPEFKELIFQLTEESLEDLNKAVKRAQDKLEALKKQPVLADQFIEIE